MIDPFLTSVLFTTVRRRPTITQLIIQLCNLDYIIRLSRKLILYAFFYLTTLPQALSLLCLVIKEFKFKTVTLLLLLLLILLTAGSVTNMDFCSNAPFRLFQRATVQSSHLQITRTHPLPELLTFSFSLIFFSRRNPSSSSRITF